MSAVGDCLLHTLTPVYPRVDVCGDNSFSACLEAFPRSSSSIYTKKENAMEKNMEGKLD